MKLLADASVDMRLVRRLRAQGHVVEAIIESAASLPDAEVLARSYAAGAVLLAEDKDFGDLVFAKGMAAIGVILIRARLANDGEVELMSTRIRAALPDAGGAFLTITAKQVRRRPLP